ncbi:MAG: response regulator [Fibromonadaceae bacterium]|jgi:signal transduction histidine kinase/CheY-like chemotaxis protein|nr:response regulator [Fibromonadaceae bacterium]
MAAKTGTIGGIELVNKAFKKYKKKVKSIFEACRDDSRSGFEDELNYEAGRLFFTMLISMIAWLPYIQNDIVLHQFPMLAVSVRIGLTLLSVILIALKFTRRFRNRPDIMLMMMIGYLNIGTALITGTAGKNATSYIGGFCFVLMLSTFSPFVLKYKFIFSISSLALFLAGGALTGLDFSDVAVQYSINDLISAFTVSMLICYILDNVKRVSWQRRQKTLEFAEQAIGLAEKAEMASKAKSDFLAKMSHEIRTPINAITGMAELALREDIPPSTQEHIFTIKQASANLLSIINDILDFSKIESGKLEIVPSDYQFSSLVNDVVSIIRMRVVDSRLNFVVNIDCNIPNSLYGDEIRIRQVLLNILSNAVKYTEKGFISFSVNGEITSDDTILLTIDVTDSGKGIKPENIGKLFGEFVQVDLVSNKGIEGTGLGLSIARSLLNAMDGDINVHSEYRKGSTFTIKLPQKIKSLEPLAVVEKPEEKSVLVYEENEIYADSMVCTIDNLGVNCERAKNDNELRKKIASKDYSFIFVSPFLLGNAKRAIQEFGSKAQVVLLTEFGNVISGKNLLVLAMPVHSISVANMLNGVPDSFSYNVNENFEAKFIAPKAKILVVDDISTNLKVADGLMLPYKMQIDLCLSGAEAIEAVRENEYDLVFMDHMMPEMDGIEAVKLIRELGSEDSRYGKLPIVALTANAVSGTREMFLVNKFNDFLSKPIEMIKLNAVLGKWIPKEKQEKLSHETRNAELDKSNPEAAKIKIEGLNVKKGIAMTGGTLERYLQTLAVFHKDGIEKIDEVKKCFETDNYHLYTTHIHALKSAAASIGANDLSEEAKELEAAGKQEDMAFIKSNNPQFLINLESLLSDIGNVLANGKKKQKTSVDPELLRSELNKLKEALEAFDSAIIDNAANALQKFNGDEEHGKSVEDILQNTLIGEYDKAVSMIDILVREMKQ